MPFCPYKVHLWKGKEEVGPESQQPAGWSKKPQPRQLDEFKYNVEYWLKNEYCNMNIESWILPKANWKLDKAKDQRNGENEYWLIRWNNIGWGHFEYTGKGVGFGKGEDEFSLSSAVSIREVTYQVGELNFWGCYLNGSEYMCIWMIDLLKMERYKWEI